MPWASIASLFGSLPGDITGGMLNYFGQRKANAENRRQYRQYIAWQTYMANTAHQREVRDLRKAGLNPILSATGGSGASVPSSSLPDMEPEFKDVGFTNPVSVLNAAADIETKKSQTDTNKALARLYSSQAAAHDLQNVSTALDNNIKFGLFDDLDDSDSSGGGVSTDDKGNITITKPAQRRGSAYVRHKLGEYRRTFLDNRHKSTALDILNLERDSTPGLLWNKEWLPRMNSAMNAVKEVGDIVYNRRFIRNLLKRSLKGQRPKSTMIGY